MRNNDLINEINGKRYAKLGKSERIAIKDLNCDSAGADHLVFVYLTPDENNIMRLWCDVDHTYQCVHTLFGWTIPDVQEKAQKKFVKLHAGGRINERSTA